MRSKKKTADGQKGLGSSGSRSSESDHQDANVKRSTQPRRSSNRIKNKSETPKLGHGQPGLADSAYDADEESVTPNSSPEQQGYYDPYEINTIEDVPVVSAKYKKKNRTNQQSKKAKPTTKMLKKTVTSQHTSTKNVPTSTPVLQSERSAQSKLQESFPNDSLSVTPEVTPILPLKPHECISPSDESFITPQIRRSCRKRSLQPNSSSNMSAQSYSSQGDSGIAMSPVSKKSRRVFTTQKTSLESDEADFKTAKYKKKHNIISKVKKDQGKSASRVFGLHFMNKKNIFSPTAQRHDVAPTEDFPREGHKNIEDSCFGFDSINSPVIVTENSPPCKPKASKRPKKSKKCTPSKDAYRSLQKDLTDSSPDCAKEKLTMSLDSESSQENLHRSNSASPSLFTDTFSADSGMELEVNKSSSKAYKPAKVKKMKRKESVSKLDAWASNFNMEIEDIEKFDLNIE